MIQVLLALALKPAKGYLMDVIDTLPLIIAVDRLSLLRLNCILNNSFDWFINQNMFEPVNQSINQESRYLLKYTHLHSLV